MKKAKNVNLEVYDVKSETKKKYLNVAANASF